MSPMRENSIHQRVVTLVESGGRSNYPCNCIGTAYFLGGLRDEDGYEDIPSYRISTQKWNSPELAACIELQGPEIGSFVTWEFNRGFRQVRWAEGEESDDCVYTLCWGGIIHSV